MQVYLQEALAFFFIIFHQKVCLSVHMAAKWGATIKTYLAGIGGMTIAYGTIMQVAASQKRSKNKMVPDGVVLHLDMGVPIVETQPSPLVGALYLHINVQQISLIK
jgi:hypothetical protein